MCIYERKSGDGMGELYRAISDLKNIRGGATDLDALPIDRRNCRSLELRHGDDSCVAINAFTGACSTRGPWENNVAQKKSERSAQRNFARARKQKVCAPSAASACGNTAK